MATLLRYTLAPAFGAGLLFLAACTTDGRTTLLETRAEAAGDNCTYAGLRVDRGFDDSGNGLLEPREILSTAFVCNQRVDGRSTATRLTPVDPGVDCEAGGQRIQTGIDDDDDGVLDDAEVDSTALVCEGVDGTDGYTTRVRLVAIASGIGGSACPYGGTRIDSGPDLDRDGVLDDVEVDSFQSVCAVQVASSLYLVESSVELPGANCANGGTKMLFGFDDDEDSILDPSELDGTPVYVCNQVVLVSGKTSLTAQTAASGAQCTYGGYVYRTGLDDDYDATLDPAEVDSTAVICNGANGYSALVEQTVAAASVCDGAGGYRVRSGLDVDGDWILDAGEVTTDNLLCNGASVYGLDGRDSLVAQTYVNYIAYCGRGALAISSGLDVDYDGYLDAVEISQTTYLCDAVNGSDGANALVEVYSDGGDCYPSKGLWIRTGTDWNGNGVLNSGEYQDSLVCE